MTATWNPLDKSASIALSNGNLTATCTTGSSVVAAVRATLGRNTGKWYFEVTEPSVTRSPESSSWGLSNASEVLDGLELGSTVNSVGGEKDDGTHTEIYITNDTQVATCGLRVTTYPCTFGIAVDLDNHRFWINANGQGFIINDAPVDITAATPSAFVDISPLGTGLLYPTVSARGNDVLVLNLGDSSFTLTQPSGFVAWAGAPVVPPTGGMVGRKPKKQRYTFPNGVTVISSSYEMAKLVAKYDDAAEPEPEIEEPEPEAPAEGVEEAEPPAVDIEVNIPAPIAAKPDPAIAAAAAEALARREAEDAELFEAAKRLLALRRSEEETIILQAIIAHLMEDE